MNKKLSLITLVFLMALIITIPVGAAPPAEPSGPESMTGSTVTQTQEACPAANATVTLCYQVYNGSTDVEWVSNVELSFPTGWTVACNSQDAADSGGNQVSFDCNTAGHQISYDDNDGDADFGFGEIYDGQTWDFCVDVTAPASPSYPATLDWNLVGDIWGAEPHEIAGSDDFCGPTAISSATFTGENNGNVSLIILAGGVAVLIIGTLLIRRRKTI